jgi:hypothetical protein
MTLVDDSDTRDLLLCSFCGEYGDGLFVGCAASICSECIILLNLSTKLIEKSTSDGKLQCALCLREVLDEKIVGNGILYICEQDFRK